MVKNKSISMTTLPSNDSEVVEFLRWKKSYDERQGRPDITPTQLVADLERLVMAVRNVYFPDGSLLPHEVRCIRKSLGHTTDQIAKLLGITGSAVRKWEVGMHSISGRNQDRLFALYDKTRQSERIEAREDDGYGIGPAEPTMDTD